MIAWVSVIAPALDGTTNGDLAGIQGIGYEEDD